MWRQRSRIQWLKEGDASTAYFHKVASHRRRLNWIEITNENEIDLAFFEHFKSLFGESNGHRASLSENLWRTRVNLDSLETPFTEEQIKKAVWQLGADKAPGPNGFPICFYRNFWDLVKDDLKNLLHQVFEGVARTDRINRSFVVLIPKTDNPRGTGDYRPICLLNCTMKIISKVLANRLSPLLSSLIGE